MAELRIRNAKVSYSDQGEGAAVVLLHAGAGSNRQWTKLTPLLGARRIIAPDFWGFGESDPWDGADPIRHDDNADLVAALIAHLGLDRVHLVGHSYGGAPATRLVLRRPELVASLVLIEPILTPLLKHAGETVMWREWEAVAHGFLDHVAAGRIDQAFEGFIDYRNGKGSWAAMPEKARERMRAGTASSVAGFSANLGNPTTVDDLRGIIAPTLMIRGENTTAPDRRVAEIVHAAIPNCEYRIVPGAEHMSPTTHPELVAAAIVAHLNRL